MAWQAKWRDMLEYAACLLVAKAICQLKRQVALANAMQISYGCFEMLVATHVDSVSVRTRLAISLALGSRNIHSYVPYYLLDMLPGQVKTLPNKF